MPTVPTLCMIRTEDEVFYLSIFDMTFVISTADSGHCTDVRCYVMMCV